MITVELITQTNYVLSLISIGVIIAGAILLYDLKTSRSLAVYVRRFGLPLALVVTIVASALTLVYSEVFGVLPCGFCWLERAMLYPQILLVATALYIKDKAMPAYGIALSAVGLIISLYHHYIQMGGSQFVACPSAGADCAKRFFFEFGFMTFPLMSAILFAFLIVLYYYLLKGPKVPFQLVE